MPILLLSLALAFIAPTAQASPRSILRKALCPFQKHAAARLLSPALLEESSEEDTLALLEAIGIEYGPCKKIEEVSAGRFRLEFKDVELVAELKLDKQNHLADFSFGEAVFKNDDFSKLEAKLKDGAGPASLWVDSGGEKIFSFQENSPLNVSRASFLFIVKALNEAVAKGKVSPKDTVRLQGDAKTISFGLLHHWADGTYLTLDTLKNLVGVENDATAADLLLSALGKEQVEKQGAFLKPILSFREIARLYSDFPPGDPPKTREDAAAFVAKLPDSGQTVDFPEGRPELNAKVGWFASTKEMCALVRALKSDTALSHAYRDLRERDSSKRSEEKVEFLVETRDSGLAQVTLLFLTGEKTENCISFTVNAESRLDERLVIDVVSRAESLLLKKGRASP